MIEIIYGHRIVEDTLHIKKISIGHGLPTYGQIDLVSLIEEEINSKSGMCTWATMKWGFGFWTIKIIYLDYKERILKKIRRRHRRRICLVICIVCSE